MSHMQTYVYALIKDKDRLLLLQRPNTKKSYAGYWNLPGGKTEPGETGLQAIIREVKEETDMEFTSPKIKEFFEEPRIEVYTGEAKGKIKISEEHDCYRWFTEKEIETLTVIPYIKKLIQDR